MVHLTGHLRLGYNSYDCILIAEVKENTPVKFRILKCNEYIVDNSDFLVCNVDCSFGGASKTLEYAKKKKIKIINLGKLGVQNIN